MTKYNGRPFQTIDDRDDHTHGCIGSGMGWYMWEISCSGSWSDTDYSPSSNMRELKAIHKVMQATRDVIRDKKILILSDNITAIANVVKEGGNNNIEYIRATEGSILADQESELQYSHETYSGQEQHICGCSVPAQFQGRISSEATCDKSDCSEMGETINRFVRHKREQVVPQVLLMEGRHEGISDGCICTDMGQGKIAICPPTDTVNTQR